MTDAHGNVRAYSYDPKGALLKLAVPDGAVLQFGNSTDGLRSSKIDGRGFRTDYSYRGDRSFGTASDTGGNVSRERNALNQDLDYTYGPFDQVASVKDGRARVAARAACSSVEHIRCIR